MTPPAPPPPDRPPDWRWLSALAAEGPAPPPARRPDPWARAARRFLRALRAGGAAGAEAALARRHPAAAAAYRVYAAPAAPLRAAVEARVLAGEGPAAVARKAALPPGAVAFYEAVFFDVRDRLGSPDFVLARAAAPPPGGRPEHRHWRALAYLGGPAVADALAAGAGAGPRPAGPDGVGPFLEAAARAALAARLAAAARDPAPPGGADAPLLRALLRPPPGGAGPAGPGPLEAHIKAMLAELPWAAGAAGEAAAPPGVRELDAAAAELRADELLRLAAGEAPPPPGVAGMTLPPPRPRGGTAGGGPALPPDA